MKINPLAFVLYAAIGLIVWSIWGTQAAALSVGCLLLVGVVLSFL